MNKRVRLNGTTVYAYRPGETGERGVMLGMVWRSKLTGTWSTRPIVHAVTVRGFATRDDALSAAGWTE